MTAVWYWLLLLILTTTAVIRPSAAVFGALILTVGAALVSGIMLALTHGRHISLQAPMVRSKNQDFLVTWQVSPAGKMPVGQIAFTLEAENLMTGEILRQRIRANARGEAIVSSAFCGCVSYRATEVRLFDLLGVWHKKVEAAQARVVVMPDTFPLTVGEMVAASASEEQEDYAPDRKGDDRTEVYQMRDYVSGDSVRQIHWKLSGKLDRLIVRDPSCPEDHSLLIFVDRTNGDGSARCVDALTEAAVSVCQALSEEGIAYRLMWNEETIMHQEIAAQDQLPEAIGTLLKSRKTEDAQSGASLYVRTYGNCDAGRILYFTTVFPQDWETFSGGRGQLFICSENDVPVDDAVVFTPENMQEVLQYEMM